MNFKEKFDSFFKAADISNEWVYSDFTDDLMKGLGSVDAFQLIPQVVDFIFEQSDSYIRLQLLGIILSLARTSGTTELPVGLSDKMVELEKLFCNSGYEKSQFNELKRFYRI